MLLNNTSSSPLAFLARSASQKLFHIFLRTYKLVLSLSLFLTLHLFHLMISLCISITKQIDAASFNTEVLYAVADFWLSRMLVHHCKRISRPVSYPQLIGCYLSFKLTYLFSNAIKYVNQGSMSITHRSKKMETRKQKRKQKNTNK